MSVDTPITPTSAITPNLLTAHPELQTLMAEITAFIDAVDPKLNPIPSV